MFKILEFIIEIMGWLKIVASPFIVGCIIGLIVYVQMNSTDGLIIGILLAVLGLIIGIVWATRVWKREGTNQFLSRVNATPELDQKEEEKH